MARKSSMQCDFAGAKGMLHGMKTNGKMNSPLNGAPVVVLTNRFSGLLVELLGNHGPYRQGERIVVGPNDFAAN